MPPLDTAGQGATLLSDAEFNAAPKLLSDADFHSKDAESSVPSMADYAGTVDTDAPASVSLPSPSQIGAGVMGAGRAIAGAAASMPSLDEYGRDVSQPAPGQDAVNSIAERLGRAVIEGYRSTPELLTPEAHGRLAEAEKNNPRPNMQDVLAVGHAALAGVNGVFRGGLEGIAALGDAVGQPQLGRDVAGYFEAGGMSGAPHAPPGAMRATVGQGLGAVAERLPQHANPIAAIGAASDIDGAIAAAGRAAATPMDAAGAAVAPAESPQLRLLRQTEGAILRRVDGDESRLTAAEGVRLDNLRTKMADLQGPDEAIPTVTVTAAAPEPAEPMLPVPEPVGAAASRQGTPAAVIEEVTPAQKATALQKMVNQSAEDRLTPQGRDDAIYVEGVQRPESMRDFSPAGEGDMSAALAHKTSYYTDSNYRGQHDALVKKNNDVMRDRLDGLIGDANARDTAMNEAKDLMPGAIDLFAGERPVDAKPIEERINEILAGPAGKRSGVRTTLSGILSNLKDAEGNLETLPSMLKGIRDDITDKLYDKSPTVEGNAARTASNQLRDVLSVVDDTIGSGLPGTKYQDYLTNLSEALGKVSKLDFLQKYITGSKKLTDLSGNLLFNKVQNLINDIQAHHADRTGGAKELTMDEINQIEAVRNELAAKDLLDRRSRVPGSPTAQVQNAAGLLGSGPLGTAVRGGTEIALHGGLALTTHGVGNAVLGGYRYFVKPHIDAARAQTAAAELAAMKARLLDTTPRADAAP